MHSTGGDDNTDTSEAGEWAAVCVSVVGFQMRTDLHWVLRELCLCGFF